MITTDAHLDTRPRNCTFSKGDWEILSALWHPVAFADEVPVGRVISSQLLDERLAIFRTPEGLTVAKDLCIHRGAEISRGWIEGNEIVCPYHGFRYGSDGFCTRVPAQPNLGIPKKLRLNVFRSVERYGLIWACLAEVPSGDLPSWPHYGQAGFRHLKLEAQRWKTSASRQAENFNDVAHLSWVHAGTIGNREKPEISPYEIEELPGRLRFRCPFIGNYFAEGDGKQTRMTQTITYDFDLTLPFASQLVVEYPDERRNYMWDIAAPISLRETRIYFQFSMNFSFSTPAEELIAANAKVLAEDQPTVESQHPEELPLDLSEEFHIRADRFSTHYRQALQRLGLGSDMAS